MKEVIMPRLGVTMQSGTIAAWLIDEGETVEKGEILFELQTEKSSVEIEAQESGVLKKILVPEDQEVSINTVIAVIGDENEDIDISKYNNDDPSNSGEDLNKQTASPPSRTQPQISTEGQKRAVPKARKLAKELGIDIETVTGTGKNGLITEKDVQNAAAFPAKGEEGEGPKVKETISLNSVKKKMAENMLDSWKSIPQFTQVVTVNMENVLKLKKELDGVTINDLLIKAVGSAVSEYPIVNSILNENEITIYKDVNISVAINSEQGLVVPVIKNVESKSINDISHEVKGLSKKAQSNQLSLNDISGGTITISNLGSLGIETGTPIINKPQSTLIFAGAIIKTPIVNDQDEIVIVPVMKLSITYDHRFIDGVTAAQFTNTLKNTLEMLSSDQP
ncbi:dihydrolipoamide acetyltransferase family protein [Alkalihalobacterium elongatum]|uniref:dihydrolipoamide acetyltransferase family protein n=1 Tax=Alkalihalobacterium elongatum TaxID=2675466 RepID=UPI001C1F4E9D|nr:dihydrolipoamide acetyltransferase family protein [Alkalihalobacterium elongatum]